MPFDAMTMAAATDDFQSAATGGRIQRILQPSAGSIALAVYNNGEQRWLLLSADPQHARAHVSSTRLAKGFVEPGNFLMLLRKYLDGARVLAAESVPGERVLTLRAGSRDEPVSLVTEVMGRHSNIILVSGSAVILGAVKTITTRQSRVRPIAAGLPYTPAPPQPRDERLFPAGPRLNPRADAPACLELLASAPADTTIQTALMGLLLGASPLLVEEIAARAGFAGRNLLAGADAGSLLNEASALYSLYVSRRWEPCTFTTAKGRLDFAPYLPSAAADVRPAHTISAAVEHVLGEAESRDSLGVARKALLEEIERRRRVVEGRIASLQDGLEAASDADEVMQKGQLLLAYGYSSTPGADSLEIPDLDMTIPLNPRLSISENADRLFRRYAKLRDARTRIPFLLADAQRDLQSIQDLAAFTRLADSEAALREIRRQVSTQPEKAVSRSREKTRGPARFRLDGFTALVGRNARENEEVTFKLARRDDLWLHARERTGAHVVVQVGGAEPGDEVVLAAAQLAAHFSEGRADTAVDVDITPVKYVRKIPGAAPGRVTYSNFKTVRARPQIAPWESVRP